jgi:C-terminal processing protease CtpA/Prc
MSCALAAKDYGLATIVGQETGEPVIGTGELYAAVTPNLHLQAYLTTKVFLAPKYHPNAQGVVPDVPVAASDTDVTVGHDPVLKRTLAMIETNAERRSHLIVP